VLCVLGPRRTTGLALWACSVVLFRVKWRAVSREEHVLGSTVRASVRGGQRKLGLPAETASSAQARSNSGVGFSCPDPVNEPSTLVILGKQGWFPDVGFRKQARKPTPPVNECYTLVQRGLENRFPTPYFWSEIQPSILENKGSPVSFRGSTAPPLYFFQKPTLLTCALLAVSAGSPSFR
jgi:hypothetical protein